MTKNTNTEVDPSRQVFPERHPARPSIYGSHEAASAIGHGAKNINTNYNGHDSERHRRNSWAVGGPLPGIHDRSVFGQLNTPRYHPQHGYSSPSYFNNEAFMHGHSGPNGNLDVLMRAATSPMAHVPPAQRLACTCDRYVPSYASDLVQECPLHGRNDVRPTAVKRSHKVVEEGSTLPHDKEPSGKAPRTRAKPNNKVGKASTPVLKSPRKRSRNCLRADAGTEFPDSGSQQATQAHPAATLWHKNQNANPTAFSASDIPTVRPARKIRPYQCSEALPPHAAEELAAKKRAAQRELRNNDAKTPRAEQRSPDRRPPAFEALVNPKKTSPRSPQTPTKRVYTEASPKHTDSATPTMNTRTPPSQATGPAFRSAHRYTGPPRPGPVGSDDVREQLVNVKANRPTWRTSERTSEEVRDTPVSTPLPSPPDLVISAGPSTTDVSVVSSASSMSPPSSCPPSLSPSHAGFARDAATDNRRTSLESISISPHLPSFQALGFRNAVGATVPKISNLLN